MKPIKLEIEGLNSFESKQVIDFESLGKGVFGIFGKTGSGKSTILDAFTLALYGVVERAEKSIDFINTKRKSTHVALEFESVVGESRERFLVRRTFTADRETQEVESESVLCSVSGGDLNVIAEGTIKVNDKILEIVGLGKNEFNKCMALPQGEFSAFLRAKPEEKTQILSNLFSLSRFGTKLKESADKRVRECEDRLIRLSSTLEQVDYATDDELHDASEKYDNVNYSYKSKKSSLNEKSSEYLRLSTALEKKKKLDELNAKVNEFKQKLPEINTLQAEIQKNQAANLVRSDYEKWVKSKKDEAELEAKIADLKEKVRAQKEDYDTVSLDFESLKQISSGRQIEIGSVLSRISELKELENEENQLGVKQKFMSEKLAGSKEKLALEEKKLAFISTSLNELSTQIENIDEFIKNNKADVELANALEQTKGIESEIILIEQFIKKLEFFFEEITNELADSEAEYNNAINEEKKLNEKINQIEKSISVAFEDIDRTNFNKIRSLDKQIDLMSEAKLKAEQLDKRISELVYDKERRQAEIANLNEEIEKTQNDLGFAENFYSEHSNFLVNERERREELLGSNFFSLASNHLRIGDDCPICGGRVVEKKFESVYDLTPIEQGIKGEEQVISECLAEKDRLNIELASLKARSAFEREQVDMDRTQIEQLTKLRQSFYTGFVDDTPKARENFMKLYALLLKTSDNLENLIDLQDMLREKQLSAIIKKTEKGTKISIYKSWIESINDILYDLRRKKAEREIAIMDVNDRFKNLKEYRRQIAEGKNIELAIEKKKEEKFTLRENQTKLMAEKSRLESGIAEINSEIAILSEKLDMNGENREKLKQKMLENGVLEGNTVKEQERLMREELENLKAEYSKCEFKVESDRELLSRSQNELAVRSSILESKREEIALLEKNIRSALEGSGLTLESKLEDYFLSGTLLKERQNTIAEFRQSLGEAESQKRDLELESFEGVSPDKVHQIKLDLDVLTSSVQELSEKLGKQSAEFEKLEQDNKKRRELTLEISKVNRQLDVYTELSRIVSKNAFAGFVAEKYLAVITDEANEKLNLLLDGKYTLKFSDGEFFVEDNLSGGMMRSVSTLSGGETFLLSLSLALAISGTICKLSSKSMEIFFLDEGFGTLDSDLCEVVVSALFKLESQNISIGLISHVSELEESIKNKILVSKTNLGSKIMIEHTL